MITIYYDDFNNLRITERGINILASNKSKNIPQF